ncbi:MAG TPA: multicopper oxidase domain-containing protein [Candidatus Binataceae bacterium]|nr:multicopper oxidase domain-containing protein [Candidatus Binataceae bacterium]
MPTPPGFSGITLLPGLLVMVLCAGIANAAPNPCVRYAPGSIVQEPQDLFSQNGVLTVNLSYNTGTDANGLTLYCFTTADGTESPTLHVNPGDTLIVNVTNNLPAPASADDMKPATIASDTVCGDTTMNASSVNIHYHGTNTPPTCHADEVIHTLVNSGETFTYTVLFPSDEPPGAYWYHPHVHGISEAAVQGGASGAIIVDGIENVQPKVAGLPTRVLVIRDQPVPDSAMTGDPAQIPAWDVSLNYVPVLYPAYQPAIIQMMAHDKEFWRVVNASADTIIDLQLKYDGRTQPLELVALDGVPIGSQDGARKGRLQRRTHILLAPAARAEFIVKGPSVKVKSALLITRNVDTGPVGDIDPQRPLAAIQVVSGATAAALHVANMPQASHAPGPQRFEGLADAKVTAQRTLYFSETLPPDDQEPTFFITVDGATPTAFDPDNPPAIVTTQGSVEDWTIENRSHENHEFHIHQIHFLLLARDGVGVAPANRQYLDMIDIPFWKGRGPYPSVKVRMDFRGQDIGDFVYHCHILEHEDNGMMAIIRVLSATASAQDKAAALRRVTSKVPAPKMCRRVKLINYTR